MSFHGYYPWDRNNWYQSPQLGLSPAGYGGGISGEYYNAPYHPNGSSTCAFTQFSSQPNPYPPLQLNPSASITNGHLFPHQFPCVAQQPLTATPRDPYIPTYHSPHSNPNPWIYPSISQSHSYDPSVTGVHSQFIFTKAMTTPPIYHYAPSPPACEQPQYHMNPSIPTFQSPLVPTFVPQLQFSDPKPPSSFRPMSDCENHLGLDAIPDSTATGVAHYTPTQAPDGSSLPSSIDFDGNSDSENKESIAPNLETNEESACRYEDLKKRGLVDKHSGSDSSSEDDDDIVVLAANSKKKNLEFFEAKIKVQVLDPIMNNKEVGLSKSVDNEIEDCSLVKAEDYKAKELVFKRHNELEESYSEVQMDVDSDGARQILNSLIGSGNGHYLEFNSRFDSHSPSSNETKTSKGSELALGGLCVIYDDDRRLRNYGLVDAVQEQSVLCGTMLERQRFKSENPQKLYSSSDTTKAVNNVIPIEDPSITTGAEPMNSAESMGITTEIHDVQSLNSVTAKTFKDAMEIEAPTTTGAETKNPDGIDGIATKILNVLSQKSMTNVGGTSTYYDQEEVPLGFLPLERISLHENDPTRFSVVMEVGDTSSGYIQMGVPQPIIKDAQYVEISASDLIKWDKAKMGYYVGIDMAKGLFLGNSVYWIQFDEEWIVLLHVFKSSEEEYGMELIFVKNSYESVHECVVEKFKLYWLLQYLLLPAAKHSLRYSSAQIILMSASGIHSVVHIIFQDWLLLIHDHKNGISKSSSLLNLPFFALVGLWFLSKHILDLWPTVLSGHISHVFEFLRVILVNKPNHKNEPLVVICPASIFFIAYVLFLHMQLVEKCMPSPIVEFPQHYMTKRELVIFGFWVPTALLSLQIWVLNLHGVIVTNVVLVIGDIFLIRELMSDIDSHITSTGAIATRLVFYFGEDLHISNPDSQMAHYNMCSQHTKVILLQSHTTYPWTYYLVASYCDLMFVLRNVNEDFNMIYSTLWCFPLFSRDIPYIVVWSRYWRLNYILAWDLMIMDNEITQSVFTMIFKVTAKKSDSQQVMLHRFSLSALIVLFFFLCSFTAILAHNNEDPTIKTMEDFSGCPIHKSHSHLSSLSVDAQSLQKQIDEPSSFSDAPAPAPAQSVTRVLYTEKNVLAHRFIKDLVGLSGLSVEEDAVGNVFGLWEGSNPELSAIVTGSYIDAIPYSGILQVSTSNLLQSHGDNSHLEILEARALYVCNRKCIGPSCESYESYEAEVADVMIKAVKESGLVSAEELWAHFPCLTCLRHEDMPLFKGGGMLGLLCYNYMLLRANVLIFLNGLPTGLRSGHVVNGYLGLVVERTI